MPVVTDIQTISNTISNMLDFVRTNEKIKEDFEEYLKTVGATNVKEAVLQALSIPYIAERVIFKENKSVPELFIEESEDLSETEKEVVIGINNTISSVFEIKKRLKNGFELYNLVNEKTYTVIPLVKMTQLSEVFPSQFALIRIFKFRSDYFMLEISDLIPSYEKEYAMNVAVAKIIERPEDLYFDNQEKFEEVKTYVEKCVDSFRKFFGTNEILTTSKKVDELITIFDSYVESEDENLKEKILDAIEKPNEYKYFEVKEFSNSYGTFLKKSQEGFSSHSEIYDVGYICEESGVYVIPFWGTLCKIFTEDNYKDIENYAECVKMFVKNDKIPPSIMSKLMKKSKSESDFEKRLLEISGETLDDIIKKYKSEYLKKPIYSSANVLYCSKVFIQAIGN